MPELYEKYSWLRPDLVYSGPKGKKAQFKGIALLPTISGNGRKYVQEELHRSARTLVGKPLTLNHNSSKILGNVSWAEFEGGVIEYVAETENTEYIEKLRDRSRLAKEAYVKKWGRDPIYGVSVEANYRYHDSQCMGGHCTVEPHGIIFNALSIVEDPERPGVSGTTVEIMETMQRTEQKITEALIHDLVPEKVRGTVLLKVTEMEKNKKEPEEDGLGTGNCEDPEDETEKRPITMETLEIKQAIEKLDFKQATLSKLFNEKLNKDRAEWVAKIGEVDAQRQICCTRLGETQKLLAETEAIAKGTLQKLEDKADKEEVQKELAKTQGIAETSVAALKEKLNQTVSKTELTEALSKLPNIEETLKPLRETISHLPGIDEKLKPILESIAKIPAAYNDKPIIDKLTTFETRLTESDRKYQTLNTVYEALDRKHSDFVKEVNAAKALKETQENTELKKLQETVANQQKELQERKDEIETLKLHVSPKFKAKPEQQTKTEPNFNAPYTYQK